MKSFRSSFHRTRPFSISFFIVFILLLLSYLPLGNVRAASAAALPGARKPLVNLRGPQTAKFEYEGSADALAALKSGSANPTALAEADFNADGAMDVVAGYATGKGGVLTLLLGNPDAFAPKDTSLYAKAMRGDVPATFLPTASAYLLPESPDLIVTGDFNHDGSQDVLVAARGGNLYLLAGDGNGKLQNAQLVPVGGAVRAMAAAADGHVAISVDGEHGSELRIFAHGPVGFTAGAAFPLPAQGDSVVWAPLGGGADLAVAAGSKIVMIYGPLTANAQAETVSLPFPARALAAGDFIWNRDGRTELAVLAADGTIHILQHGTLDTRPLTAADIPGRRAAMMAQSKQPRNATALGAWTVARQLPYAGPAPSGPLSVSAFNSPRLAASSSQDLMVLDAQRNQLNILDTSGKTASPGATASFPSAPVAALALPQKINAERDTVVLTAGRVEPMIMPAGGDPTFNVNTTADVDPIGACTSSSVTTVPAALSLREAVCLANNNAPATSTINVPPGTYKLTSLETGELQIETGGAGYTLTIIGTGSAPGDTIIQQTDGVDRIFEVDFALAGNTPLTLQNMTLTGGTCSNQTINDCEDGGGAILAGGIGGDSLMLTYVVMNNNTVDAAGQTNDGGAINDEGPDFTITNSTFTTNSGGSGGAINFNDIALDEGSLTITGSTFASNTSNQGGALNFTIEAPYTVTVTGSNFSANQSTGGSSPASAQGGAIYGNGGSTSTTGYSSFTNNRFANDIAEQAGTGLSLNGETFDVTATDNWWGCNAGPGSPANNGPLNGSGVFAAGSPNTGCDSIYIDSHDGTTVDGSPWLIFSVSADPTQITTIATSTLTAALNTDSNGGTGIASPAGLSVSFGGTLGTASPTTASLSDGQATSTFTSGSTAGAGSGTATLDHQTVNVTVDIASPPSITSAASTTFTAGSTGSFNVTTTGFPTPSISETGALPAGVTLTDNGNGTATLAGTPAAGTGGSYPITITAQNGASPNATQSFTLTVDRPPAITSASGVGFSAGNAGSFTVTTSGYPTPALSETGSLPGTVTFTDNGNGTATLAGTAPTANTFPITITANNGVSPNAQQSFTLTVNNVATALTSPTPGSTLTGPSATFKWKAGTGATSFDFLLGTDGVGSNNLWGSGPTTATSVTFGGLPTNGQTINARLYATVNGVVQHYDYTYTAASGAVLTSPSPGSTLTGRSQTFRWSTPTGATAYDIWFGTTGVGSNNIWGSGPTTATSVTFGGLPTNGQPLYVRLFTTLNGFQMHTDAVYTAESGAVLTSPAPGGVLPGPSANFQWSAPAGATAYDLWIGTTGAGSNNLWGSGPTTANSFTFGGLPTNGEPVYVRLFTTLNGIQLYEDFTYTATTPAVLTAPPLQLTGKSATFQWAAVPGATGYDIWLGTTGVGSNNLWGSGATTATSVTFNALPTNGEKIYVRLFTFYNGGSAHTDTTYTAYIAGP